MPGGSIQELTLCFDTKDHLTKDDLRILLIKSAQELLYQINMNLDIQKFLKMRPFAIESIQIVIYNHDKNRREVYDPEISTAEISQGILNYQTVDSNDTFKYKNEFTETYDEALKAKHMTISEYFLSFAKEELAGKPKIPNKTTLDAHQEALEGSGTSYKSMGDFWSDMGIDRRAKS